MKRDRDNADEAIDEGSGPSWEFIRTALYGQLGATVADLKYEVEDAGCFDLDLYYHEQDPYVEEGEEILILEYLIEECGANLESIVEDGVPLFHLVACVVQQPGSIRYLLDKNHELVNLKRSGGETPLFTVTLREDEFACQVLQSLIEGGAEVNAVCDRRVRPLHEACLNGTPEMVRLLIANGADVQKGASSVSPLNSAILNTKYSVEIVALLFDVTTDKEFVLNNAIRSGTPDLVRYLLERMPDTDLSTAYFDPSSSARSQFFVENIRIARPWGADARFPLASVLQSKTPSDAGGTWCALRAKKNLDAGMVSVMLTQTSDPQIWQRVVDDHWLRLGTDTILHVAARSEVLSVADQLRVIRYIARHWVNPFVLDADGKKAIEYCDAREKSEVHAFLASYQSWSATREKTRWFGPMFEERALTLMLCLKQLGYYQRDIRHLLVMYVARTECLFA